MSTTIKTQARLLARHLKSTLGIQFTHSQALEALAAMLGEKDYNVVAAKTATPENVSAPVMADLSAKELLKLAMEKGLCVGDAVTAFSEQRSRLENLYADYAQENCGRDGELEFDSNCIVSLSSDGGAYVQGWYWIDRTDLPAPASLLEAIERGFETLDISLNNGNSYHLSDVGKQTYTVNEEALAELGEDKPLPDDTPVITFDVEGKKFVLTLAEARAFEWDESEEGFYRDLPDNAPEDALDYISLSND